MTLPPTNPSFTSLDREITTIARRNAEHKQQQQQQRQKQKQKQHQQQQSPKHHHQQQQQHRKKNGGRDIITTTTAINTANNRKWNGRHHQHHQQSSYPETPNSGKSLSMMMTTTERLKACLNDNSMTDVYLMGEDGIRIPAIRCVLGSASPVLKQLLYTTTVTATPSVVGGSTGSTPNNKFISSSSSTAVTVRSDTSYSLSTTTDDDGFLINLEPKQKNGVVHLPGFRSKTIRALVEYCCSDGDLQQTSFFKTPVLAMAADDDDHHQSILVAKEAIIEMLDFAQLAINYEIPKVPQQVVDDFVTPLTKRAPQLATLVFNYLLTVEFPQPTNATSNADNNSAKNHPLRRKTSSASMKEAKEVEKVVSASLALTKLWSTSLSIIRSQPYAALVPVERKRHHASSSCSYDGSSMMSSSDTMDYHQRHVGGILALQAETLRRVISDSEIEADELFLFRQLKRWHDHHKNLIQMNTRNHKIKDTLQKMVKGGIDNDIPKMNTKSDKKKKNKKHNAEAAAAPIVPTTPSAVTVGNDGEFSEDSFQFEANFQEFMMSNADSVTTTSATTVSSAESSAAFSTSSTTDNVQDENDNPSATPKWKQQYYCCPNPTKVCKELVHHLDLAAIDPVQLREIVSTTEFVDQEIIMNALWEQATAASKRGRLSFGSIVRGTGRIGAGGMGNLGGGGGGMILDDLVDNSSDHHSSNGSSSQGYQNSKSHILVQGAGMEDCNGIYVQVTQQRQSGKGGDSRASSSLEDDESQFYSAVSSSQNLPSLMCASSSESTVSSRTTSTNGGTSGFGSSSAPSLCIPTGICLRFVKHSKRKNQNKGKTYYLVCRRELVPSDLLLKRGNAAPFQHQWSIIEEDNKIGGQLRVLYEWLPENLESGALSGNISSIPTTAHVFDSSTLQRFPDIGWTSVRDRYHPAPFCKWYRPRFGSLVLVVPPAIPTIKKKKVSNTTTRGDKVLGRGPIITVTKKTPTTTTPTATATAVGVPPPPPLPFKRTESAMADSLVGLPLLSSVSCSETSEPNRRVAITITDNNNNKVMTERNNRMRGGVSVMSDRGVAMMSDIQSSSSGSSSFRLTSARKRVSLADASLDPSDPKPPRSLFEDSSAGTESCEI